MMQLWLLRPRDEYIVQGKLMGEDEMQASPWHPWYDKAFGYVIRAESETAARQIAAENDNDLAGA